MTNGSYITKPFTSEENQTSGTRNPGVNWWSVDILLINLYFKCFLRAFSCSPAW
jgi:hypothetical protein